MKKLLLITSFLTSQLFAVQCTEQQYSPFFTDKQEVRYVYSHYRSDNSYVVIDKQSIVYDKKNQKITCWTISQRIEDSGVGISKIQWEYNLKNNQYRNLSALLSDCESRTISSSHEKTNWQDIVPESGAEKLLYNLKKYLNIKQ